MSLVTLAICTRVADDLDTRALPVVASITYARRAVIDGGAATAAAFVGTAVAGMATDTVAAVVLTGTVAAAAAVPTDPVARMAAVNAPMILIRIRT
ncbi:hypothetical protein Psi02_12470 [Planotetraspora silvatica]|uniref:Uncharacterized protein n=1 Tax=Planotetraspora silvatica TaxID=234614 RepID=A0A8J3XQA4_9ACTN|nr:hypothetical protein Psi02_12470 [Planotetraspora silvatica]